MPTPYETREKRRGSLVAARDVLVTELLILPLNGRSVRLIPNVRKAHFSERQLDTLNVRFVVGIVSANANDRL